MSSLQCLTCWNLCELLELAYNLTQPSIQPGSNVPNVVALHLHKNTSMTRNNIFIHHYVQPFNEMIIDFYPSSTYSITIHFKL